MIHTARMSGFLLLALLSCFCFTACNEKGQESDTPAVKGKKWLGYNERMAEEEKTLRKSQKVQFISEKAAPTSEADSAQALIAQKQFDAEGHLLSEMQYTPDGALTKQISNTYKNGHLV
ncbi:MAG: hypothetical protein AAF570_27345, partial [Bacteroidota bacterium]